MRLRMLVAATTIAGISATVLFAQAPKRDGKWEVTMEMSMAGMQMPATTTTQCITPADAADPMKSVPQAPAGRGGAAPSCKMSDYKVAGNKVTYTMTCEPPQAMTMTAEMIYAADSYTGTMTMNMDRGGQPMAMTMKYSGKRLGDCVK